MAFNELATMYEVKRKAEEHPTVHVPSKNI